MSERRIGDAPIEPQYVEMMNDVARAIDVFFNGQVNGVVGPKKTGFVLLVFPFEGREGRCNYISNADRGDVIVMLKEQLRRFEGQPEMKGHA